MLIRPHRNDSFIRTLQQWIDGCRGARCPDINDLIESEWRWRLFLGLDFQREVSALIVRSVIADRLAAWTQSCYRHLDSDGESAVMTEPSLTLEQRVLAGD